MLILERKDEMQYRLNMPVQRRNQDAAFSLVELLVVIGIIGILAALLLTAVSQSKKRAQQIQCVNNLHQIGVGLQNFLANNHGYPAFYSKTNTDYPGFWCTQLERDGLGIALPNTYFYATDGVWRCPSAQWDNRKLGNPPNYPNRSYGYNTWGVLIPTELKSTNALGLQGHYFPSSDTFTPIAESEVTDPSDMMAIGDIFGGLWFGRRLSVFIEGVGYTASRHQGKLNVVFCDGHVESPTLQFLFEDTSDAALVRWDRDHLPHREKLSP